MKNPDHLSEAPLRGRDTDLTEYYFQALQPFEDKALFRGRLFAENSYLRKNPGLRTDIATLLQGNDDQSLVDMIEILDLSRQLDAPANQTPFRALMAQLTLSREINELKVEIAGETSSASRANALMNLVGRKLVDAIPDDQLYEYELTANFIRDQINTTDALTPDNKNWFGTKSDHLATLIEQRVILDEYLEDMPEKDPVPVTTEQITRDNEEIAVLFSKAREHQRYGVKIGYKQQEYRPGSLVFSPPIDLDNLRESTNKAHHLIVSKGDRHPLAFITDSHQRSFKKKIAYEVKDLGPGRYRANFNIQGRYLFTLLDNGELTTFHSDLGMADKAASKGAYNAYRHLQAEILADFIDLTSDFGFSRQLADIHAPKATDTNYTKETGTDIVRKLLLPRATTQVGGDPTATHNSREVRLHGVVWHTRRLPDGWHASPEALQLAQEAHIKLAPGETFVRSHQRGSKKMGEVVVHQFVNRES